MTTTVPAGARAAYRGGLAVPSSGWAPGYTQANLVVLPRDWAFVTDVPDAVYRQA